MSWQNKPNPVLRFTISVILINPLLTKFVLTRWLDIGLNSGPQFCLSP